MTSSARDQGPGSRRVLAGLTAVALALGSAGAGLLVAPAAHAAPTVLSVTTTADLSGCDLTAPVSLRKALCHAATAGGEWRIDVPAGTYLLDPAKGPLTIAPLAPPPAGTAIAVVGVGAATTAVDGQGATRILDIDPDGVGGFAVTLSSLALRNGLPADDFGGGAIIAGNMAADPVDLTLKECAVTDSAAAALPGWTHAPGGGVQMNGGDLTVENCTFARNDAPGSTGGAISWFGYAPGDALSITGSTFTGNSAQGASGIAGGGAVAALGAGTVTITGSRFVDNSASGPAGASGGAVRVEHPVATSITDSLFERNLAAAGTGTANGGALYLAGPGSLTSSVLAGNSGPAVTTAGALTTADVWWDCLAGPTGGTPACQAATTLGAGTATHGAHVGLRLTAAPTIGLTGTTSTVTATVTRTPAGTVPSEVLGLLAGRPLTWSTTSGTLGGAGGVLPASGTATATLTIAGTATVRVGLLGVSPSTTVERLVPAAVLTHPASTTVVEGSSANFTATAVGNPRPTTLWQVSTDGGTTWADVAGASTSDTVGGVTSTLTVPTTAADHGDRYRVTFSNAATPGGATVTSNAAILTVHTLPALTTQPADTVVIAGEDATFTVAATGRPAPTVQWQRCGGAVCGDVPGATGPSLTVPAVSLADSGATFRAVVTNVVGAVTSTEAALTVHQRPVVTADPEDLTVTEGDAAWFEAAGAGVPNPGAQWQVSHDGGLTWASATGSVTVTPVAGTVTTRIDVAAADAGHGDRYRVRLFNTVLGSEAAQDFSAPAVLTVQTEPAITAQPSALTVLDGADATFTVAVSGRPTPTVQWQRCVSGTCANVSGATGLTLTVPGVAYDDAAATYQAVVTNVVGSVTSAEAALTVHLAAQVTTDPADLTILEGAGAWFEASGLGVPAPAVTWQVSHDGGATWAAAAGTVTTTPTGLGEVTSRIDVAAADADHGDRYRARVANTVLGSQAEVAYSAAALLTLESAPVVTTDPVSVTVLTGDDAVFTAAATGRPAPTVRWLRCDGGTCTPVAGATGTTLTLPVTLADSGVTVHAEFTNSRGTVDSASATVTVHEAAAVTTDPADLTIVAGDPAWFEAAGVGTPAPTVTWQVSRDGGVTWVAAVGTVTTTPAAGGVGSRIDVAAADADHGDLYRARFANTVLGSQAEEAVTASAALAVRVPPAVSDEPADTTVLAGSDAVFTAAATGRPAPTVQWVRCDAAGDGCAPVAGATGTTLTVPATLADSGVTFRAVFTNDSGTATSRAAALTVHQGPSITGPGDLTADLGDTPTLTVVAAGTPAPLVTWQRLIDGAWADVPGATGTELTLAALTRADDGARFRAVATNAVAAVPGPAADLTVLWGAEVTDPAPATAAAGAAVAFTVAVDGNPAPALRWETSADGTTWTTVAGATDPTLTVTASAALDGARYRAVATNTIGAGERVATSAAAALDVVVAPTLVTGAPATLSGAVGEVVTARYTVTQEAATARWQESRDGTTWTDLGEATVKGAVAAAAPVTVTYERPVTLAAGDEGRMLRLVVTNAAGSLETPAVTLRVVIDPGDDGGSGGDGGSGDGGGWGELGRTGADVLPIAALAGALVAAGAGLVLVVSRRRVRD